MPGDSVVVKRTLPARVERVFAAWTRPELMARWFFPGEGWTADVRADVREGGEWSIEMRDPSGALHVQTGRYREIRPPRRLVFTWSCLELGVEDSVVTIELDERDGRTVLTLTHVLPPDPLVRREHEEGWDACLGQLERVLGLDAGDPERSTT